MNTVSSSPTAPAPDRRRPLAELPRVPVPAALPELSSTDLKLGMAGSGAVFSGYVLVHMLGNLKVYQGEEKFNAYAEFLRTAGAPVLPRGTVLWGARAVLTASLAVHVGAAAMLTARAWRANGTLLPRRPRRPRGRRRSPWEVARRSMRSTGGVLGLFTAFHVLDLTTGTRPAASRDFAHGSAYANLVASLSRPPVAVAYAVSMAALAAHLVHGIPEIANDIGAGADRRTQRRLRIGANAFGAAVAVGNTTIPVAVLTRAVR
ncbi:succinate dehydrogenase cytochrome b subunit [Kocuria sp. SM24M-10]|uniref:succinate dehydrogenase cytochrome b subunit n=1 Tax=Kocuria sp. SM24M-10 TaxID=1660349 RepID=UPI0009E647B8